MTTVKRFSLFLWRLLLAFVKVSILIVLLTVVAGVSTLVTMRYLIVGEEVVVPSVVGLSRGEAEAVLARNGLYLAERTSRHDAASRVNQVLEQEPQPDKMLKANKRVYVVLSLGSRQLTVPDMAGLTLAQARVRLSELGLEMGDVVLAKNSHVVEGAVAAHQPPAGAEYFKGSPIAMLVSAGPEEAAFVMPDLIGRNMDDVISFLQGAGLRLGDVREEDYVGLDAGVITQQQPRAGSRVAPRDIISLTVVRGAFGFDDPLLDDFSLDESDPL